MKSKFNPASVTVTKLMTAYCLFRPGVSFTEITRTGFFPDLPVPNQTVIQQKGVFIGFDVAFSWHFRTVCTLHTPHVPSNYISKTTRPHSCPNPCVSDNGLRPSGSVGLKKHSNEE
ncbi:MAG: hypothetical protein K1Y36_03285 [Blastocatellia bacterium]|nr:hypothetical protein [Blastocatellia bacterium]